MKAHQKRGARPAAGSALQKQKLVAAVQLLQAGHLTEARTAYKQVLSAAPDTPLALNHLAIIEHQLGRSDEALRLFKRCLKLKPDFAEAYSDMAAILLQLGRDEEAFNACRKAISLNPNVAAAHSNQGDLLRRQGDHAGAEAAYARATGLQPDFATAHASRADALAELGRLHEAQEASERAIRLAPGLAMAYGAKGVALYRQGKTGEAISAYEKALQLDSRLAIVHTRLANALKDQGLFEQALAANDNALKADPACVEACCNQALILQSLGRYKQAFEAFSDALAIKPDFPEALSSLGLLLHRVGDADQAVDVLRKAVTTAPGAGHAYVNLGSVLKDQGRHEEALDVYRQMLEACGDAAPVQGLYDYCNLRRHICDWNGLDDAERQAIERLKESGERMPPFAALAMPVTPQDHLDIARLWAGGFPRAQKTALVPANNAPSLLNSRPIRIGYLSADFHQHATATLIAEVIERHDRDRFEAFAYCFSPDDGSPMRQRLKAGFDHFRVIEPLSHTEAAEQIARDGIDILVDLKGYTRNARTMILAQRPAPIQVNYLGYPGTMGASFIDYIIADPIVAPMDHQRFFEEKIVQLPDCYQPNDGRRALSDAQCSRAHHGLPEKGFVFCSFNNAYKITAPVFDAWMRLLERVPGSILWLLDANALAKDNLRREAAARGVEPERLVFAPKLPNADHLARYCHADLFLDNLPVNAHTTASEALWMGVPVITCIGDSFVGRVAASLLTAIGAPELITRSLADYESLAWRLATNPDALSAVRARLADGQGSGTLFDAQRYTANLEAAFAHMVRLHAAERAPEPFSVAELGKPETGDVIAAMGN